jgi:hypothetical protein
LIDPQADLPMKDAAFWKGVWAALPPPSEVEEIWSGIFDWVTDQERDWKFEQLYPVSPTP